MKPRGVLCWIPLVAALAGCVSAPPVQTLPEPVRAMNAAAFGDVPRRETGAWWTQLHDDVLGELIAAGLAGSPSPRIALARLAQAEADLTVARSARWPMMQAIGSREVRDFSGSDPDTRSDLAGLDLRWDAGLWGKRRLEIERARQFREQRWFEHQAVALALSSSIAETYYQVVEQRTQSSLLAAQVRVSRDLETLIEARFRLGQAPANELYQQREQTAVLVQLQLVSDTRQALLEKSLDVLLGEPPDTMDRVMRVAVPDAPGDIGFGTPEELIRHRADVRASYARLRQAAADVGLRFVERLPALQVTASWTSAAGKALSSEWVGHGIDLAVPLFTGGRLRGLQARARHALEEARQHYLAQWLSALQEVSSLKWEFEQQQKVIATLTTRRGHARQALDAARNRYTLGDQNYLDVLTALRGLQEADRFLVSERRQLLTIWIRAMEALGQPMCAGDAACRESWLALDVRSEAG